MTIALGNRTRGLPTDAKLKLKTAGPRLSGSGSDRIPGGAPA